MYSSCYYVFGICAGVCQHDQFQCMDYSCVPALSRCDGIYDCKDGADEANCGQCLYSIGIFLIIRFYITHSHSSAKVFLMATKQVNGKGQNSTLRHTKTP